MRKMFIALVAALTIAGAVVTNPGAADARARRLRSPPEFWADWRLAQSSLAPLLRTIMPRRRPRRYYAPAPAYYAPQCGWVKQRYWDGYYWRVRRVPAC